MSGRKPLAVIVHAGTATGRCAVAAARKHGYETVRVGKKTVDTSSARDVEQLAARIEKSRGSVEIVIICPGVRAPGPKYEPKQAESDRLMREIVSPPLNFARSFGRRMRESGRGKILNLVSNAAFEPRRDENGEWVGSVPYSAAMAAVAAMTRQLATEFGSSGVLVNALIYGGLEGDESRRALAGYASRAPLGRPLSHREIEGSLSLFLAPGCGYITGQNIVVDGGTAIW